MATESFTGFSVISDVGVTANSYVSVADTKAHWNLDAHKTGHSYTDDDIGRAVITATSQMDSKYWDKYLGTFYDDTYALHFPRVGTYDSRGVLIDYYDSFPSEVARATAIQAWYVLDSDRQEEVEVSSVKKLKMDGLGSKEFFSTGSQANTKKDLISSESADIISPYISGSTGKYTTFASRG